MGQVTSASRLNVQFFANGGVTPIRKTLVSSILPLLQGVRSRFLNVGTKKEMRDFLKLAELALYGIRAQ